MVWALSEVCVRCPEYLEVVFINFLVEDEVAIFLEDESVLAVGGPSVITRVEDVVGADSVAHLVEVFEVVDLVIEFGIGRGISWIWIGT